MYIILAFIKPRRVTLELRGKSEPLATLLNNHQLDYPTYEASGVATDWTFTIVEQHSVDQRGAVGSASRTQ
jgi:hypothetical protein